MKTIKKLGLGAQPKKRGNALNDAWSEQLADELHKPIRRNFVRRRVIVNGIDEIGSADLVDMLSV